MEWKQKIDNCNIKNECLCFKCNRDDCAYIQCNGCYAAREVDGKLECGKFYG